MKIDLNEHSPFGDLPPLPNSATTRHGVIFDPRADEWVIASIVHEEIVFRFRKLEKLSKGFIHKLKLALVHYATTQSDSHFRNIGQRFWVFYHSELSLSNAILNTIELHHIIDYRSALDAASEWKLGVLRILFLNMETLGYSVCSTQAVDYLRDATIKGNDKGTSVRTRDPQKGPFSDSELLAIQSTLNDAYANGDMDLSTYAMAWLFLAYGVRPIQIAPLKEKDLIVGVDRNGIRFYALRIPRAKQPGWNTRELSKVRYCSKQIGHLLETLIQSNSNLKTDPGIPDGEWPLFIGSTKGHLPDLHYHLSSKQIGTRLKNTLSHLTGLKMNSRRFRITFAQRAVDDGKDPYTVAELLDHSDTQNVAVYYEPGPAMVERLDRHLAMELAPLAQAFAGVLVLSEADASRGDDPSSRIYDKTLRNNVDRPLGTCGQLSFCGLYAPFACYTCRHFQPWLEAAHEEFLGALLADRDRMIAEGYSPKIYNIKNRTILAVAEV
ncbi:site-specific integrase, partial [Mesorhizobium sp.]|uniref:site-specific integrase n=1 Tax=Mesorhizobium sp. TaxID=1871066 RepID=UPI0025DCDE7E